MVEETTLAEIEVDRSRLLNWFLNENRFQPFEKDTPFSEFLERLEFIESLKTREDLVDAKELEVLPGYMRNPRRLRYPIGEIIQNFQLSIGERNKQLSNWVAEADLGIIDNYGCKFILDNPFPEMRRVLETHYRFREEYRSGQFLDNNAVINIVFRRDASFSNYERAVTLELRRYKEEDPSNVAHLIFHGMSAGIAGTIGTLVECVKDFRIPTHFGGSSKTRGVGIIYKPE